MNLAVSRYILKVFVLMIQPRTDLVCSNLPSPKSLRIDMAQSRWIGSCGETGRKRVWMASGTASRALSVNSGLCNDVVIISSIYTSICIGFGSKETASGKGFSMGLVSGCVGYGSGIRCESGLLSFAGTHEGSSTSHWAMSAIVSLQVQNSSAAGVDPNGNLASRYAMRSIIVMHNSANLSITCRRR